MLKKLLNALKGDEKTEVNQDATTSTPSTSSTDLSQKKPFSLREKLKKTRENLLKRLETLFLGEREIDEEILNSLEELLVTADIGIRTVEELLNKVKDRVKRRELSDVNALMNALRTELLEIINASSKGQDLLNTNHKPHIILVVGVNGVGKTTSIAKLGYYLKSHGKSVLFAAGDTFRAAAIEQLETWAQKLSIPVIRQNQGADPSAVVFDAVEASIKRNMDYLIIDTAGRLHTKTNLMEELKKIKRTIAKKIPLAPHDIYIVIDANTGQNALQQTITFHQAINLTGIILTKLDSTSKGGILISIINETKLPVKFIGVGEGIEDLRPFDPTQFVDAILKE